MAVNKSVIMGRLSDGKVCFADVQADKQRFTVRFDTVEPMPESVAEEMARDYIDDFRPEEKLHYLEEYDCSPSDLSELLLDELGYKEFLDCSLFNSEVAGYVFLSASITNDFRTSLSFSSDEPVELAIPYDKEMCDTFMEVLDAYREAPLGVTVMSKNIDKIADICERLPEKYSPEAYLFIEEAMDRDLDEVQEKSR